MKAVRAALFAWAIPFGIAQADEQRPSFADPAQSVFAFGGVFLNEDFGGSFNPFGAETEDGTSVFGVGYQAFFYRNSWDLSLGVEAGLAGRFTSSDDSLEGWSGVVARYDGLTLFNTVNVAPALTFGLSAVSSTLPGREQILENIAHGDATLLFYVAPELNISFTQFPQAEAFYRIHHRSGALETLGDMEGASNASVFGLRVKF